MINNPFKTLNAVPTEVRIFLYRAMALFIGWKLLYILILIPNQIPDAWLVKQLGNGTAFTLHVFDASRNYEAVHTTREKVYGADTVLATYTMVKIQNGRNLLGIYQACNGLELMVLYAGFILCFSGFWPRKLLYILAGVLGLYLINVLRCFLLANIVLYFPNHFDFAHKYFFNLTIYSLTFVLWVFYVRGLKQKVVT